MEELKNKSAPESPEQTEESQSKAPPPGDPLSEIAAMIDEMRALFSRLFTDISSLMVAQARLTSYVVSGTVAIWAIKARTTLSIWGLVTTSWVFLNVSIWMFTSDLTSYAVGPPLSLVIFNASCAVGIHLYRKGIHLT